MEKILCLDQSSRITGYAIFEDEQLIDYGKFDLSNISDIGKRLVAIRNFVKELIEDKEITTVIFEDIQYQSNVQNNVQTFKILAEVFGVIYELLEEMQIPHQEVLAGTWKSTLGIKGKNRAEQKRNAQAYIQETYGLKPTQDECDAICIGTHYLKNKAFNWSV